MEKVSDEVMAIVLDFAHYKEVNDDVGGPNEIEDIITEYFKELTSTKEIPHETLEKAKELIKAEWR